MLLAVLILTFSGLCGGQLKSELGSDRDEKVYNLVPISDRGSLREAVDRFVKLQTSRNWNKLYDLLDNQRKVSREHFVREIRGNKLLRFVPQAAAFVPPEGAWLITGCGFFKPTQVANGKGVFSSVHARKTDGGWRLTPVAIVLLKDEPGGTRPCASE
jgi:hypothetical protein